MASSVGVSVHPAIASEKEGNSLIMSMATEERQRVQVDPEAVIDTGILESRLLDLNDDNTYVCM